MDAKFRQLKNNFKSMPWRLSSKLGIYKGNKIPIKFIVENKDWAIISFSVGSWNNGVIY